MAKRDLELQEVLLSQRGRTMLRIGLRVCQYLASTAQYLKRSLLLLVTSASYLPMRTIKLCYVVFGVMSRLPVIKISLIRDVASSVSRYQKMPRAIVRWLILHTVEKLTTRDVPCNSDRCQSQILVVGRKSRFLPQLVGSRRNIAITSGMEKLECGYPTVKMFEDFDSIHERDRQTDRRTPHSGIGHAYS